MQSFGEAKARAILPALHRMQEVHFYDISNSMPFCHAWIRSALSLVREDIEIDHALQDALRVMHAFAEKLRGYRQQAFAHREEIEKDRRDVLRAIEQLQMVVAARAKPNDLARGLGFAL